MAVPITPERLAQGNSEHAEQCALFCWAQMNMFRIPELRWLHAIPNGGLRSPATASRMVAEGARKGVLDVFWPLALGGYHGLYIEMKYGKNKPDDQQIAFMAYAERHGYRCAVCWSWEEAVQIIEDYYALRV